MLEKRWLTSSFVVKELQSLALDVRVLDKDGEEIELSDLIDDDTPTMSSLEEVEQAVDRHYAGETDEEEEADDEEGDEDGSEDDFFDEESEEDGDYDEDEDFPEEEDMPEDFDGEEDF